MGISDEMAIPWNFSVFCKAIAANSPKASLDRRRLREQKSFKHQFKITVQASNSSTLTYTRASEEKFSKKLQILYAAAKFGHLNCFSKVSKVDRSFWIKCFATL